MDCDLNYIEEGSLVLSSEVYTETNDTFFELFKQYERVVVESLANAFLLDTFLIKDRLGGNVDTIHNVRQEGVGYKDLNNKKSYENRGEYNSNEYHSHENYIAENRKNKDLKEKGLLRDEYTGKIIGKNDRVDLDHTIAAKEIHDDPARVLADVSGADMANNESNLHVTDMSINRSKKQDSAEDFIRRIDNNKERLNFLSKKKNRSSKENKELIKLEKVDKLNREKLREIDEKARREYNSSLNKEYYSSKKFWSSTLNSSMKVGKNVATRQALGIIFTETWVVLREDFKNLKLNLEKEFDLSGLIISIGESFKRAVSSVVDRFGDLIESVGSGFLVGVLSDISNTILNICHTTAKSAGKILRASWSSIVEAVKILVFNEENLGYGDQIKAVSKIIFTSISVIIGSLLQQHLGALILIPVLKDIVPIFLGSLVTGLLSVTMLYYMDNSPMVTKLVDFCNRKIRLSKEVLLDFEEVSRDVTRYAAELASIDFEEFEEEIEDLKAINNLIYDLSDPYELNTALTDILESRGIQLPYSNRQEMDNFMNDPNMKLVF